MSTKLFFLLVFFPLFTLEGAVSNSTCQAICRFALPQEEFPLGGTSSLEMLAAQIKGTEASCQWMCQEPRRQSTEVSMGLSAVNVALFTGWFRACGIPRLLTHAGYTANSALVKTCQMLSFPTLLILTHASLPNTPEMRVFYGTLSTMGGAVIARDGCTLVHHAWRLLKRQ